jgi:hypothetical protein
MNTKSKRVLGVLLALIVFGVISYQAHSVTIPHTLCVPSGCDDTFWNCVLHSQGDECVVCYDSGSTAVCVISHTVFCCISNNNWVACGEAGEGICYEPGVNDNFPWLYCGYCYPSEDDCYMLDCNPF